MGINAAHNDFLLTIQSVYPSLTKAEKKVADYILQNPKGVRFMSITDLADACSVSLTSVFRFCKTLRLRGYQEFKVQLALSMNDEEESEETELLPAAVTRADTVDTAAKKAAAKPCERPHRDPRAGGRRGAAQSGGLHQPLGSGALFRAGGVDAHRDGGNV